MILKKLQLILKFYSIDYKNLSKPIAINYLTIIVFAAHSLLLFFGYLCLGPSTYINLSTIILTISLNLTICAALFFLVIGVFLMS